MSGSHSHPNKKSHLFGTRGTICCLASLTACCLGLGEEVGRLGLLGGLVLEVYSGKCANDDTCDSVQMGKERQIEGCKGG